MTRPLPGSIPDGPGSYQFVDRHGRVLYVGKAKSLRSRIGSYFQDPAGLAPLGSYGGPTVTRPLLPGSPAIAAGIVTLIPGAPLALIPLAVQAICGLMLPSTTIIVG